MVVIYSITSFFFNTEANWYLVVAGLMITISFCAPFLLLPLNRLWEQFATKLGHFNNGILLGGFYYLIIFPTGLIPQFVAHDPFKLRFTRKAVSYR